MRSFFTLMSLNLLLVCLVFTTRTVSAGEPIAPIPEVETLEKVQIVRYHCGTIRNPGWYVNDEGVNAYVFNNIGLWPDCGRHMWIVSIPTCQTIFHGNELYACHSGMIWQWKWDSYLHDPVKRTATAKGHWQQLCPVPDRWTAIEERQERLKFRPIENQQNEEKENDGWQVIRQRQPGNEKPRGNPNWLPDTRPDVIRR